MPKKQKPAPAPVTGSAAATAPAAHADATGVHVNARPATGTLTAAGAVAYGWAINPRELRRLMRGFRDELRTVNPELEVKYGPVLDCLDRSLRTGPQTRKFDRAVDYLEPRLGGTETAQAKSALDEATRKHCKCSQDTVDRARKEIDRRRVAR
jgi:hypothetical protein